MKHLKFIGVFTTLIVAAFAVLNLGQSLAATTTNTTLAITAGQFTFYKDTGTDMNSYFPVPHSPNTADTIDIGSYAASISTISASSSGDHRFTVSDMLGSGFTVTLYSSDLTATNGTIAASNITYTGTDRYGTGKALTATGTFNTPLNSPVTFVSRTNNDGLSKYSQEITILVAVPAAQAPGSYTGVLTFTY